MTALPTIATDSLYKFMALFGIVLFAFGVWYPEERFRDADAKMREELKIEDLARIKVNRKKAQTDRLTKESKVKSNELATQQQLFDETRAGLESKSRELDEELTRAEKGVSKKDAEKLKARADLLGSEVKVFVGKLKSHTEAVNRLTAESNALVPRLEEVADDLSSEIVISKSSTQAIKALTAQAENWFLLQNFCAWLGILLVMVGFILWQVRIQRFQDIILRSQARDRSND